MDTLSVSTVPVDADRFEVRYKYAQLGAREPGVAGRVLVSLAQRPDWTQDRAILAELAALHHLLCVREVQGANRLGNRLCVEVSAGAIKKAVAKNSLKREDAGTTAKVHVARFCQFLATKYFQAQVEVVPPLKWKEQAAKRVVDEEITVDDVPDAGVDSVLGRLVVRRHALNRFIERCLAAAEIAQGKTLMEIPDERWTRAWRALETIVPQASRAAMPPHEAARVRSKYGTGATILHHVGSQCVFVVNQGPKRNELVTVIKGDEYCKLIELPKVAGQKLVYAK